jgi:hypothetical protein
MMMRLVCASLALLACLSCCVATTTETFPGTDGFVSWPDALNGFAALIPENPPPANFECSAAFPAFAGQASRTCEGGVLWSKTVLANGYTNCACYEKDVPATVTYNFDSVISLDKIWFVQYGANTNHIVTTVSVETSIDSVTFTEVVSATSVQGGKFGRTIVTLDSSVQAKSVRVTMIRPDHPRYGPCFCSMQLYGLTAGPVAPVTEAPALPTTEAPALPTTEAPTLPTTEAPESTCFEETIGVRCGLTGSSNNLYIADGERYLARTIDQTEAAFVRSCEALCSSASSVCGGFNLILAGAPYSGGVPNKVGLGACYFRKDATVGIRTDSQRNCYVRQQSQQCTAANNAEFDDAVALFNSWDRAQKDAYLALVGETCQQPSGRRLLNAAAAASEFVDKEESGGLCFEPRAIGAFAALAFVVGAVAAVMHTKTKTKNLAQMVPTTHESINI